MQTVNSNGCHVMSTISADEYKMSQSQKDNGGGYCVHSFVQLRAVRESSRGSDRRAMREEMPLLDGLLGAICSIPLAAIR